MKNRNNFLITICLGLVCLKATAQTDPHFTQQYSYPLYINPALTGSGSGEYRVSTMYRNQWGGFGNPYRTTGVSVDARTNKNIAVGVNLMNQKAGDAGFNYFNAYGSVAYTGVKLGKEENHRVVFALQAGLINRRVDQNKFKWGEQWNPITGYQPSNPTSESFANTSATTFDMGTGVLYFDAAPNKKANVFGGVSFFHINKPKDPIISQQSEVANTIPLRSTIHGGVSINMMDGMQLVPHIMHMQQRAAKETSVGVYLQKQVTDEATVMAGGYYRVNDALAPFVGLDYKNFTAGLSYDINSSSLGKVSGNVNSFELSISYNKRSDSKSIFDFIRCPRF